MITQDGGNFDYVGKEVDPVTGKLKPNAAAIKLQEEFGRDVNLVDAKRKRPPASPTPLVSPPDSSLDSLPDSSTPLVPSLDSEPLVDSSLDSLPDSSTPFDIDSTLVPPPILDTDSTLDTPPDSSTLVEEDSLNFSDMYDVAETNENKPIYNPMMSPEKKAEIEKKYGKETYNLSKRRQQNANKKEFTNRIKESFGIQESAQINGAVKAFYVLIHRWLNTCDAKILFYVILILKVGYIFNESKLFILESIPVLLLDVMRDSWGDILQKIYYDDYSKLFLKLSWEQIYDQIQFMQGGYDELMERIGYTMIQLFFALMRYDIIEESKSLFSDTSNLATLMTNNVPMYDNMNVVASKNENGAIVDNYSYAGTMEGKIIDKLCFYINNELLDQYNVDNEMISSVNQEKCLKKNKKTPSLDDIRKGGLLFCEMDNDGCCNELKEITNELTAQISAEQFLVLKHQVFEETLTPSINKQMDPAEKLSLFGSATRDVLGRDLTDFEEKSINSVFDEDNLKNDISSILNYANPVNENTTINNGLIGGGGRKKKQNSKKKQCMENVAKKVCDENYQANYKKIMKNKKYTSKEKSEMIAILDADQEFRIKCLSKVACNIENDSEYNQMRKEIKTSMTSVKLKLDKKDYEMIIHHNKKLKKLKKYKKYHRKNGGEITDSDLSSSSSGTSDDSDTDDEKFSHDKKLFRNKFHKIKYPRKMKGGVPTAEEVERAKKETQSKGWGLSLMGARIGNIINSVTSTVTSAVGLSATEKKDDVDVEEEEEVPYVDPEILAYNKIIENLLFKISEETDFETYNALATADDLMSKKDEIGTLIRNNSQLVVDIDKQISAITVKPARPKLMNTKDYNKLTASHDAKLKTELPPLTSVKQIILDKTEILKSLAKKAELLSISQAVAVADGTIPEAEPVTGTDDVTKQVELTGKLLAENVKRQYDLDVASRQNEFNRLQEQIAEIDKLLLTPGLSTALMNTYIEQKYDLTNQIARKGDSFNRLKNTMNDKLSEISMSLLSGAKIAENKNLLPRNLESAYSTFIEDLKDDDKITKKDIIGDSWVQGVQTRELFELAGANYDETEEEKGHFEVGKIGTEYNYEDKENMIKIIAMTEEYKVQQKVNPAKEKFLMNDNIFINVTIDIEAEEGIMRKYNFVERLEYKKSSNSTDNVLARDFAVALELKRKLLEAANVSSHLKVPDVLHHTMEYSEIKSTIPQSVEAVVTTEETKDETSLPLPQATSVQQNQAQTVTDEKQDTKVIVEYEDQTIEMMFLEGVVETYATKINKMDRQCYDKGTLIQPVSAICSGLIRTKSEILDKIQTLDEQRKDLTAKFESVYVKIKQKVLEFFKPIAQTFMQQLWVLLLDILTDLVDHYLPLDDMARQYWEDIKTTDSWPSKALKMATYAVTSVTSYVLKCIMYLLKHPRVILCLLKYFMSWRNKVCRWLKLKWHSFWKDTSSNKRPFNPNEHKIQIKKESTGEKTQWWIDVKENIMLFNGAVIDQLPDDNQISKLLGGFSAFTALVPAFGPAFSAFVGFVLAEVPGGAKNVMQMFYISAGFSKLVSFLNVFECIGGELRVDEEFYIVPKSEKFEEESKRIVDYGIYRNIITISPDLFGRVSELDSSSGIINYLKQKAEGGKDKKEEKDDKIIRKDEIDEEFELQNRMNYTVETLALAIVSSESKYCYGVSDVEQYIESKEAIQVLVLQNEEKIGKFHGNKRLRNVFNNLAVTIHPLLDARGRVGQTKTQNQGTQRDIQLIEEKEKEFEEIKTKNASKATEIAEMVEVLTEQFNLQKLFNEAKTINEIRLLRKTELVEKQTQKTITNKEENELIKLNEEITKCEKNKLNLNDYDFYAKSIDDKTFPKMTKKGETPATIKSLELFKYEEEIADIIKENVTMILNDDVRFVKFGAYFKTSWIAQHYDKDSWAFNATTIEFSEKIAKALEVFQSNPIYNETFWKAFAGTAAIISVINAVNTGASFGFAAITTGTSAALAAGTGGLAVPIILILSTAGGYLMANWLEKIKKDGGTVNQLDFIKQNFNIPFKGLFYFTLFDDFDTAFKAALKKAENSKSGIMTEEEFDELRAKIRAQTNTVETYTTDEFAKYIFKINKRLQKYNKLYDIEYGEDKITYRSREGQTIEVGEGPVNADGHLIDLAGNLIDENGFLIMNGKVTDIRSEKVFNDVILASPYDFNLVADIRQQGSRTKMSGIQLENKLFGETLKILHNMETEEKSKIKEERSSRKGWFSWWQKAENDDNIHDLDELAKDPLNGVILNDMMLFDRAKFLHNPSQRRRAVEDQVEFTERVQDSSNPKIVELLMSPNYKEILDALKSYVLFFYANFVVIHKNKVMEITRQLSSLIYCCDNELNNFMFLQNIYIINSNTSPNEVNKKDKAQLVKEYGQLDYKIKDMIVDSSSWWNYYLPFSYQGIEDDHSSTAIYTYYKTEIDGLITEIYSKAKAEGFKGLLAECQKTNKQFFVEYKKIVHTSQENTHAYLNISKFALEKKRKLQEEQDASREKGEEYVNAPILSSNRFVKGMFLGDDDVKEQLRLAQIAPAYNRVMEDKLTEKMNIIDNYTNSINLYVKYFDYVTKLKDDSKEEILNEVVRMRQEGLKQFDPNNEFGKVMVLNEFEKVYQTQDVTDSSIQNDSGDPVFILPQSIRYLKTMSPFELREGSLVYVENVGGIQSDLSIIRKIEKPDAYLSVDGITMVEKISNLEDALQDATSISNSIKILQKDETKFSNFLNAFSMHVLHTQETLGSEYYDDTLFRGLFSEQNILATIESKKDELSSSLTVVETIDELYTDKEKSIHSNDRLLMRTFTFLTDNNENTSKDVVLNFNSKNNFFEYMKYFNYIKKDIASQVEESSESLRTIHESSDKTDIPRKLNSTPVEIINRLVSSAKLPSSYRNKGEAFSDKSSAETLRQYEKLIDEMTVTMKSEMDEKERKQKEEIKRELKGINANRVALIQGSIKSQQELDSADLETLRSWLTEANAENERRKAIMEAIQSIPDFSSMVDTAKPLQLQNRSELEDTKKRLDIIVNLNKIPDLSATMMGEISILKSQNLQQLEATKQRVKEKYQLINDLTTTNKNLYLILEKYSNIEQLRNSKISELKADFVEATRRRSERQQAKEQLEKESQQSSEAYQKLIKEIDEQKAKANAAATAETAAKNSWLKSFSFGFLGGNNNKSKRLIGRKLVTAKKPQLKTGSVRKRNNLVPKNKTSKNLFGF